MVTVNSFEVWKSVHFSDNMPLKKCERQRYCLLVHSPGLERDWRLTRWRVLLPYTVAECSLPGSGSGSGGGVELRTQLGGVVNLHLEVGNACWGPGFMCSSFPRGRAVSWGRAVGAAGFCGQGKE